MELLLTLIELKSCPRLAAIALRTKVAFLEDKLFVQSRSEASPGDMILMPRCFGALRITAATGWPSSSSLPSVSSVALGEDDESDSRTEDDERDSKTAWLVAASICSRDR